jgi:hypothetical protein
VVAPRASRHPAPAGEAALHRQQVRFGHVFGVGQSVGSGQVGLRFFLRFFVPASPLERPLISAMVPVKRPERARRREPAAVGEREASVSKREACMDQPFAQYRWVGDRCPHPGAWDRPRLWGILSIFPPIPGGAWCPVSGVRFPTVRDPGAVRATYCGSATGMLNGELTPHSTRRRKRPSPVCRSSQAS